MRETLRKVFSHPIVVPGIVGVASFAGGAVGGYFYAMKKMYKEVEEVKDEYQQLEIDFQEDYANLEAEREELRKLKTAESKLRHPSVTPVGDPRQIKVGPVDGPVEYIEDDEEEEDDDWEEEPNVVHIFQRDDEDWDYETELQNRAPDKPYILHRDEFFGDEMGYEETHGGRVSMTWYEGDQILTDSKDVPIYDVAGMVGEFVFGHGSGDPNICYVRNERLELDIEILRDDGKYSDVARTADIERQAEDEEIRHSREVLRFRD